jgi:hypothetical protein
MGPPAVSRFLYGATIANKKRKSSETCRRVVVSLVHGETGNATEVAFSASKVVERRCPLGGGGF